MYHCTIAQIKVWQERTQSTVDPENGVCHKGKFFKENDFDLKSEEVK
jgi:hypothetical protein